jgi:hypothetical protein
MCRRTRSIASTVIRLVGSSFQSGFEEVDPFDTGGAMRPIPRAAEIGYILQRLPLKRDVLNSRVRAGTQRAIGGHRTSKADIPFCRRQSIRARRARFHFGSQTSCR